MKKILNLIKKANYIAIFTHMNADADALGSVGAFSHCLLEMGKNCDIFLSEKPTWKYDFLKLKNVKFELTDKYDLYIALDIADSKRLGIFCEEFLKQTNTICVDHHIIRNVVAKNEFVDVNSSSTCEILFDVFKEFNQEINPLIASCLYCGILGDTGGFMFSNTTAKTHLISAKLIECGADINLINKNLFGTHSKFEIELIQKVISRILFFDNIAISYITQKDKHDSDDIFNSGELVDILRSIENVEVAVLLKQIKGKNYSVSLRSNNYYDVASFASHFGGGGHKRAAGMSLVGSINQVKKIIVEELQKFGKSN